MSTQNENLLVKLIKKSVGLSTGKSNCCDAPAEQSNDCCSSDETGDCCGADASQSSSCGCCNESCGRGCCGVDKAKEVEAAQEE